MAATVDQKLLRQTKFPSEFSKKVDMKKVNVEVMKKWIAGKISDILGNEDDVVIELCFNLLEGSRFPDIKVLQIQLTGFLDKDTAKFCKDLWNLCLSAQENPQGVPKELLEAKKLELIQEKIDAEKAAEEARRRKEAERKRDRDIDNLRHRERAERGRGGRGRYGRGDQGGYRQTYSDRSPPPSWRRRRSRDRSLTPPRRDADTYAPRGRDTREPSTRYRSPPRRQRASRSRTPPTRRRRDSSSGSDGRLSKRPARAERGRPDSPASKHRARSFDSSSTSRSPSPRPRRRRSLSKSTSPPPRAPHGRSRRYSSSSGSDDSRSPPRGSHGRRRRSSSSSSASNRQAGKRADNEQGRSAPGPQALKPGASEPDRRHSRSPAGRSGRAARADSHSSSRSGGGHSGRKERRGSPASGGERRRQRSLERYRPVARRRRSASSSGSSPHREKRRRADETADDRDRATADHGKEVGGHSAS